MTTLRRVRKFVTGIFPLLFTPSGSPDLLKAQYAVLSRLVPPMYFVIIASSWALAASHWGVAPTWLTLGCPVVLSMICGLRITAWWRRRRNRDLSVAAATKALAGTKRIGFMLATSFTAWAIALFSYGDAYTKSHTALFLATSMMGCIACLTHLRVVSMMLATCTVLGMVGIGIQSNSSTLLFMLISVVLIMGAVAVAATIQSVNFQNMVTAQSDAQALINEQHRLLRMIDDMPGAVMTADPVSHRINYFNEATRTLLRQIGHLLPIEAQNLIGMPIDFLLDGAKAGGRVLTNAANLPYRTRLQIGAEVLDVQIAAVRSPDGDYLGPMLTWAIVTGEVAAENRIRQLAHYDTLTGLANRTSFRERLEISLTRPDGACGLLFIDLDGFKIVNDSKGHLIGDTLLGMVANRLRRACDYPGITIARLGGDEFAVLADHCAEDQLAALAAALLDALTQPYLIGMDLRLQIGASIGIAHTPLHGRTAETLLSRADMALYAAKSVGKGTFMVFSAGMEERIQDRVYIEAKLRDALDAGQELCVYYQPIVDIDTQQITAREALIRWQLPGRGWVPPVEFIPVAEESGLIDRLGTFVLRRACIDAAGWSDGARVAVNISPSQLGRGTLASTLADALRESGLPPDRLEIEVTESTLVNDAADCIADLREARAMGVRVALDDFGTGFSSLVHLRAFPFDKIKVDGSFVRDAVTRQDCAAVVKAIADLGKRLGVTTVAEGVETQEQLDCVIAEGCREVQGYLFGRPMPNVAEAQTHQYRAAG